MYNFQIICLRAVDGDTLAGDLYIVHLKETKNDRRFRLFGINCPEHNMPGGKEATEFTSNLVTGKILNCEVHGVDAFGRLLVDVFIDGELRSLNQILLDENHAVIYKNK